MVHDLKTKLLSGILISTKPQRFSYRTSTKNGLPFGGIMSMAAVALAAIGLFMFLFQYLKMLF